MDQRKFNSGMSKFDALDTDGGDVAALLGSLPRVEAPGNFEFGVRARMAKGVRPAASLLPFLKVAVPLSLVLLIGALVVFYRILPGGVDVPVVPETARTETDIVRPPSNVPEPPAQTLSSPQIDQGPAVMPDRASVTPGTPGPVRRRGNSEVARPTSGGSFDISLGTANTKLPRGFESPQPRNLNANTSAASADVPVRSVLGILGITADFAEGGWKVQSVAENSIASSSSIMAGDVIEAIDGQQQKGDSVFKGSAKTLTIRREGKTLNVNLTKKDP